MTLSMIPRGIAAALAACSILLVLAAPAAVAGGPIDETTTTAITSPGDPFFTYEDESAWDSPERGGPQEGDPNTLTITGTADGNDELGLRCYYSEPYGEGRTDEWVDSVSGSDFTQVGENAWTFKTTVWVDDAMVDEDTLGTCRLRAVPEDEDEDDADLAPFHGPRLGVGYWDADEQIRSRKRAATRGILPDLPTDYPAYRDFDAEFPQLEGVFAYNSVGDGGVTDAMPFAPGTFAAMGESAWWLGSGLLGADLFGTGHSTLVDGVSAFNAYDAPAGFYSSEILRGGGGGFVAIDGQPELKATIQSFDHATGNVVIREEQEMVRCDTPAGVDFDYFDLDLEMCPKLVPTGVKLIRLIRQHRDGRVAQIEDEWSSTDGQAHNVDLEYANTTEWFNGRPAWRIPGAPDYTEYGSYDEIEVPADQVGSFYKKDVSEGDGGLPCPPFCIFDRASDGASDFATGSLTYAQRPDRAIFGGPQGFVLHYNRGVPATGTTKLVHAFGTGRTQGEAEAVGADMENEFRPAAAQQQSTSAPPQQQQSAPPAQVVRRNLRQPVRMGSLTARLKGRKFSLKVACVTGAQGGTLKVRTRKGKRFTIGTRSYQCPAGGSRTVTFTLTRSQWRKLRRLGRRVPLSTYTVARDEEGKPVSIGQIVTLTTR